jgi:hypothetical protein
MKSESLRLIWAVLSENWHEAKKEALRGLEDHTQPEEARRTKRIEGNKYDENSLLGGLKEIFGFDKIWSEKEARTKLNRPAPLNHLLFKIVLQRWAKKGNAKDFANFDEQREKQGATGTDGCRTFYQLIPNIHEVSSVSTEKLAARGK